MSRAEDVKAALYRLAELLSDQHGTEILAEMQKAGVLAKRPTRGAKRPHPAAAETITHVGPWRLTREATGVALHADAHTSQEANRWADVGHVPAPADARRIVLLGESSARGFLLDPDYAPAFVLQRVLDADAPGEYQCVDLACTGADLRTHSEIVDALPTLQADVIVLYAGNNWMLPRYTAAHLSTLGRAMERGGRKTLRADFWLRIVRPDVDRFLARLVNAATVCGSELVVIIPEFNLLGWHPAEATSVPCLDTPSLSAWRTAIERCRVAIDHGRWSDAQEAADQAIRVDEGISPASLHLAGIAALRIGDHKLARHLLELSRDVSHGTLLSNTPGVTTEIQEHLVTFCESNGIPYVDLRTTLAKADGTGLPDPSYFLDYCHLSADGVDLLVGQVREIIRPSGANEAAVRSSASSQQRALSHLLAACHAAHCDQPQSAVRHQLELAVECDPEVKAVMHSVLDLLEGAGPAWAQPAMDMLRASAQLARYFDPMLTRQAEDLGLWSLREEVGRILGRVAKESSADLIAGTSTGGVRQVFRPPNHTPTRAYHQATTWRTRIGFARSGSTGGTVELTARAATASQAIVSLNGIKLGQPTFGPTWTAECIDAPPDAVRAGINWLEIEWPVPIVDVAALWASDVSALACGRFPSELPIFAELFTACWRDLGASS